MPLNLPFLNYVFIHLRQILKSCGNFVASIAVAARSKAWVYGRSLAGIGVPIPAGGMDVCLLSVLCVIR